MPLISCLLFFLTLPLLFLPVSVRRYLPSTNLSPSPPLFISLSPDRSILSPFSLYLSLIRTRTHCPFLTLLSLSLSQRKYQMAFDEVFLTQYQSVHRLETNKLRNVAKFFAHLLGTDGLPWTCLEYIKLNETDTTSSSRIFIKVLAQELSESLGMYCFILQILII